MRACARLEQDLRTAGVGDLFHKQRKEPPRRDAQGAQGTPSRQTTARGWRENAGTHSDQRGLSDRTTNECLGCHTATERRERSERRGSARTPTSIGPHGVERKGWTQDHELRATHLTILLQLQPKGGASAMQPDKRHLKSSPREAQGKAVRGRRRGGTHRARDTLARCKTGWPYKLYPGHIRHGNMTNRFGNGAPYHCAPESGSVEDTLGSEPSRATTSSTSRKSLSSGSARSGSSSREAAASKGPGL